jgi:OmcA/MtrC family decaheme c-type cytochrome
MAQSRIPFVTVLVLLAMVPLSGLTAADKANKKTGFTGQLAAKHLDENQLSFIRPGITVKLVSAAIATDGTITARVTITDPKGLPLDRDGITTPGSVNLRFIAATIPAGKTQYLSYTTTVLKSTTNSNPSQVQAATDSGGTFAKNADGDYTYTFKTKAPVAFDATATHAIGVSAQRDLSEFMTYDEWSETSNDVLNFVPNGAAVTVTRSITPTAACNKCHDPLFGHGGSRLTVEMCILCHSPQTINPDTLLTQDMPVLIHKIHMGKDLPSVKAGTPYRIWHRGAWSDFSTVAFPQDVRNCTVCHAAGAPQADNWKTNPSRAVCGSCHDNVNFATGENHVDLPMLSDNECKNCHTSQQTLDFDASIPGAHVVPNNSISLPGVVSKVLKVENAVPGSAPVITFSLTDKAGNPLDITKLTQVRVLIAGPNTDYQTGEGGIYVRETITTAPGSGGVYTYTATNKIPAGATGSYTVSIQARNTVLLLPGTKKETSATDSANPTQFYFSVDSSPVVARRVVVSTEKCAACHDDLKFVHGGTRNDTQACTICHNPTLTDGTSKQSVNFAWQIHATHRGEGLANPYVLGTTNYQEVRFPGDTRDCSTCHVGNSYQPDNIGAVAPVASTGGFTATTMPIAAACQGCHDDLATASHALNNTTTLGESCVVCHGQSSQFSMDKVHSRTK